MSSDDVQIKFYGPAWLRTLVNEAAEKDLESRTLTQWMINAAIDRLKKQGYPVEPPVPKKKGRRT